MQSAYYTWDGFGPVPAAARGHCYSIGNFDGVHRGHAELIQRLRELSDRTGSQPWAVTFDPPPASLLRPQGWPKPLTTTPQKARLLHQAGAAGVLVLSTSDKLLQLAPTDFYLHVLLSGLNCRGLVEGYNFCFGKDRQGTVELLRQLTQQDGIPFEIVPPVQVDGRLISSSRVRSALEQGDVAEAALLLGRPYELIGQVVVGQKRGRDLGFPTANLAGVTTLVPAEGVYAGWVDAGADRSPAAIHVGTNPTFGENERKIEAHLIGFQGDLYSRTVVVAFIRRLRGTHRFSSVSELITQLRRDVQLAQEAVS